MPQVSVIPEGVNRPDGMFTAALSRHYGAVRTRLWDTPPPRPAPKPVLAEPEPVQPPPQPDPAFSVGLLADRCEPTAVPPPQIQVSRIIAVVSARYGLNPADIMSDRRTANYVAPRQVIMYLARKMTSRSFPMIGKDLGGKDHTTIFYGAEKVAKKLATDEGLAAEIDRLRRAIIADHYARFGNANDNGWRP
jgi:hypothetical protein